jgi:hypothetical protein
MGGETMSRYTDTPRIARVKERIRVLELDVREGLADTETYALLTALKQELKDYRDMQGEHEFEQQRDARLTEEEP